MSASTPKHTKPHHVNAKFRYEITGNELFDPGEKNYFIARITTPFVLFARFICMFFYFCFVCLFVLKFKVILVVLGFFSPYGGWGGGTGMLNGGRGGGGQTFLARWQVIMMAVKHLVINIINQILDWRLTISDVTVSSVNTSYLSDFSDPGSTGGG